MEQSLRMVEQCLDRLPDGPVGPKKPLVRVKPKPGEYYHCVESPRGQFGLFIVADKNPEPWRIKARTPSFSNLSAMAEMLEPSSHASATRPCSALVSADKTPPSSTSPAPALTCVSKNEMSTPPKQISERARRA